MPNYSYKQILTTLPGTPPGTLIAYGNADRFMVMVVPFLSSNPYYYVAVKGDVKRTDSPELQKIAASLYGDPCGTYRFGDAPPDMVEVLTTSLFKLMQFANMKFEEAIKTIMEIPLEHELTIDPEHGIKFGKKPTPNN